MEQEKVKEINEQYEKQNEINVELKKEIEKLQGIVDDMSQKLIDV